MHANGNGTNGNGSHGNVSNGHGANGSASNGNGSHAPALAAASAPSIGAAPGVQEIVAQQLALMQAQLDLLRGAPSSIPAAAQPTQAPAPVQAPRFDTNGVAAPARAADTTAPTGTQVSTKGAGHGPHRPVSQTVGQGGGFDARQQAHVDELIRSFNARTAGSKAYTAANRAALADNRATINFRLATKELMYPIVGERSEGARLWDVDGNEYVDFTIGFGVHFFGHRPEFIVRAVEDQLRRGFHLGPQSDLAGPTARLFSEMTGMERVAFCNTGSEAVMTALRVARAVSGRDRVVLFEGSYHGCFDGILARAAGTVDGTPRSRPVAPGTTQGMVDDIVVLPYGPESLDWLRANAKTLAAVLVEPVQSRNPEFHPREFLHELRALTAESGTALVFDEMITGLRLERRGAQGFYGVDADLATYGKVIGGGFPLGVVAGRARWMDAIDGGTWNYGDDSFPAADQTFFAGTFCKHPVTMAAAHAVLTHLKERGPALYEELNARTARVVAELRRVIDEEGVPMRIPTCASLFQFRFEAADRWVDLLFHHMLERGIYIWEGRGCFLSTAHTDDDCDRLVRAFRESVHALRRGGFLPEKPGGGGGGGASADDVDPSPIPADLKIFPAPATADATFPLTPAQRQIWVHCQLGDDAARAYNEQIVFALRGRWDEAAMRAAVRDLMRHHDALRLSFDAAGEWQRVSESLEPPVRISSQPGDDLAAALQDAVREVFDLQAGPPFRVHVHVRGDEYVIVQAIVHHLAADGFSAPLLERDLRLAYRARAAGESPRLPEAMRWSEYAALLGEHARTHAAHEAAWLGRFRGAAPLDLATDRPRPRVPTSRGATERRVIPAALADRLRETGRREGCTLFNTMLAGVLATLHRATGQDDLVVGIASAGRPFPGSGSLVGDCADVLPIRSTVADGEALLPLLKRVRGALLDAYENEVFAYTRLQEKLDLPRGPGQPPLISLVFNLEPPVDAGGEGDERARMDLADLAATDEGPRFAKFDLTLDTLDRGGEVELICLYNTDLFDGATVARLLGQLEVVLGTMVDAGATPVRALELMSAGARATVLDAWNRTEAAFPDACLHQLFEAHAAAQPDAHAVIFGGEPLTYRELDAHANRLARHLAALGVGPEVRVGLCLERSPELVAAILGVLKAGGAYVPLDPSYPAERLERMLAGAEVSVVVTEETLRGIVPALPGVAVVSVDGDGDAILAASAEPVVSSVDPANLAYVIFTSGSTGVPKGIALAHRGVVNNLHDLNTAHGVGADDRVLLLSSLSFDMSVYETLGILAAGGAVVIPAADELRDPARWAALMRSHAVSVWNSAPALLGMLADHLDEHPDDAPAALRLAFLGGDWVPVALPGRIRRHAPDMAVIVMGGATEASIHSIIFPVREVDPAWRSIPYGVPMANQRAYVLDDGLRPVPVGAAGELYLAGVGLARGYTGRAGFTAERFLPDPFGRPGARMYRTGDRARWKADGNLELIGRLDVQVKIRGFRIELGEIEAVLRAHPGVERCVVAAREDVPGDRRLVAYVVGVADPESLRRHAARSLPEYMVPAAVVVLDRLPLSPNGKVDRKSLPAPEWGSDAELAAPRTPAEEVLAGVFAEVLGRDRVGTDESFFELGGHSLLATRVAARVRAVFGVEMNVRALFEAPTVESLAAHVDALRRADLPPLPPVTAVDRDGPMPLSSAQERLWFLHRMDPASPVYNIPVALRIGGALNPAALERALGEVVRRHESLRTTFHEAGNAPVQAIAPFDGFSLAVDDLTSLDAEEREAEAMRRAADDAARPFDLAAGPLFRASLLKLAADDHVLLLCLHHVIGDGWSLGVLFRELSAAYAAFRDGAELDLPQPALQYADYAAWERRELRGAALDRQLAWWTARLAGAPALLELPTDRPRPAVQTYRGGAESVELPAALLDRVRDLARGEGATPYMVLLGAFQLLLAKYAGTDDVVVGSPIAGRTRRELEDVIGFFANTLALRTDLSGDPTFREALRRVRETTLGAYEHQDLPFERLVDELQPERSLGHSPVFQVAFTLTEGDGAAAALPGLETRGIAAELDHTKFDLTLSLTAHAGGLSTALGYRADLWDATTVRRMLGHFRRVLEQVVSTPDAALSAIELADEAERALVVDEWNRVESFPADACLHDRFEAQVRRTPDAVAVSYENASLTYAELNARANRLAHHLRRHGVGPEHRVALCLERSLEMVVGIVGVLKAGGAYVPIDPTYPAERIGFVLGDCGAQVVVSTGKLPAALPEHGARVVLVGDAALADESAENPESGATPESLAYVIYTSGSTGTPKGTLVEHRQVARLFTATEPWFGFGAADVWTLFHSYAFDFSVWEIWGALLHGGRLVVVPFWVSRTPDAFHALLQNERVTVLNQTPSAFRQLMQADGERGGDLALRWVIFGGEALEPAALRPWIDRRGDESPRLANMYGITETTVHVTFRPLTRADVADGAGSPIGVRIPDLATYVLDAAGNPCPVGVPGELYVGGAGVARGYLNQPELTAQRFVRNPFGQGRLYRTGDRARWLADGSLEYLGRLDEQVKIRGFRIELGEIEAALRKADGVSDCAVIVREDEPGEPRIAAYLVGSADAETLKAELGRTLPEYMLPAAFVAMDALPLTPNGKLDRRALPAPEQAADAARYVAPRTPVEEVLAGIFAEVLRAERVGVNDNFFDAGGHSLLATRVTSRIRDVFGVRLPLRALFAGPTVAELAERVEALRRAGLPAPPPLVPVDRAGPLPVSFGQERLWFVDRLEGGSTFYHVVLSARYTGAMDVPALERALGEVVRRHEVLRTTFREAGEVPVQVVAPFAGFRVDLDDLSHLAGEARDAELKRRLADDGARPFDLAAGPLFRATLYRLADDEHVLLIGMHHVVCDAWSMAILFRELSALYEAYRQGRECHLPDLPVQYADYAAWQRNHLQGEVLEGHLAYWRGQLAGAPPVLELPTDRPRPPVQSYRGAGEPVHLSREVLDRLNALARGEGATLYMVLLGAFQVLLAKYAGTDDVVVGSPIAGRTRHEVEGLIGFFINTLVLRTQLGGDPSFREVVRRVREVTLGAYEHQDVPFEKLVAELQPERSLSHSPFFQAVFSLQNVDRARAALAGLAARGMDGDVHTARYELTLDLSAGPSGLGGVMVYATDLWDAATIQRMLAHFARLVEQASAAPDVPLSKLALVDADERRLLIDDWNRTASAYPRDVTLHALFDEQVRRAPDAEALAWGGECLSYAELDARANRLAHHLAGLGVGPESRVAVMMERGIDLVVSILAVIKAGGCYVPLDPSYPAERLRLMMADSAVRVLVTHSAHTADLASDGITIVEVDTAADVLAAESPDAPDSGATAGNLAYVVYTSGSTGRPKGVMVGHREVVQLVRDTNYVDLRPGDRIAQASNASFDALAFEMWGAFLNGATLVGIPRDVLLSPPAFARMLRDERITTLYQTTALLNQLSREQGDVFATLREVLFGGQAVDADSVRRLLKSGKPRRLLHVYGPTETTAWCSFEDVRHVDEDALTVSVGRPTANARIYILDSALEPVPVGVAGEAYVGGGGIVRGYLDRPGLTAERFVPDPFAEEPGARMYRTGDRLRWKADGTLEFVGRIDEQVKIRGFRIEPGEVESMLTSHPDVREARVIAREDEPGEQRLVAYLVGEADAEELKAFLRRSLPEYMVPSAFVALERIPLTPSGKLDRRALPAPRHEAETAADDGAPESEVRRVLADIWCDLLRAEGVGPEDDFFELGGHSLLIMRLIAAVQAAFGVELSIRAVFAAPTLGAMAGEVERAIYDDVLALSDDDAARLLDADLVAGD
jgi:amino acid adenylation domain-containing protein